MFSAHGHFSTIACPDGDRACKRAPCPFSHAAGASRTTFVVAHDVEPASSSSTIPAKRPAAPSPVSSSSSAHHEPPRKFQRVEGNTASPQQRVVPAPAPSTPSTSTPSAPTLRVNAAQSKVPVILRQTMLQTLFDHFLALYQPIIGKQPDLPASHALQQEAEIHERTNKITYRNAVKTCLIGLKKRVPPDSVSHISVGTDGQIAERKRAEDAVASLVLTRAMLEPLLLSEASMLELGYMLDIPADWGPGGEAPAADGAEMECDRCKERYVVRPLDQADERACKFHWGRLVGTRVAGDRQRMHTCCAEIAPGNPCDIGPHVFYEKEPALLHARHAFSLTEPDETGTALDIAALDCEMVYSTGGMRIARVSVVDSAGDMVFDQLVRMDAGVSVIDFNTRFSGVTSLDEAVLDLDGTRAALKSYISSSTILIGHALDNDLKTLRMVHTRCIDTVALFPHKAGWPYRRALRDLARECLNRTIQNAGAAGHSSVEDSVAALDLVKFYIVDKRRP